MSVYRTIGPLVYLFVFTGNALHIGDHIPWHRPFDDTDDSSSKIQHILESQGSS